jgi:hypothetical protein
MSVVTQQPAVEHESMQETWEAGAIDRVACRDCGLSFPAGEGLVLHFALKGPCPECGGSFQLDLAPASPPVPLSF